MNSKQLTAELFKAYFDARRNKRGTKSQLKFEMDLEHILLTDFGMTYCCPASAFGETCGTPSTPISVPYGICPIIPRCGCTVPA